MTAILDLVDELRGPGALSRAAIEKRFGVELTPSEAESNAYFRVSRGPRSPRYPTVGAIELREPVDRSKATSGPLVVLDIDPKAGCVTYSDLRARYGPEQDMLVPTPHEPPGSPIGFLYRFADAELRFGVARDDKDCVVSVLLQQTR